MNLHRRSRRTPAILATAAASAVILAACAAEPGDGEDAGADDNGDNAGSGDAGTETAEELRLAITSDEGHLTPHTYATGSTGLNLMLLSYDTLLQVDADGVPQPWLADDVEISEDGTEYTLTITEGATWHDGEPITAEDVAFSYQYYQDGPPGRFATATNSITEVNVDGDQVTFSLETPNASFELRTLADVPVLAEHIWADVDDPDNVSFDEELMIGSGPYRLVESSPGTEYVLEAYEDYFRGAPTVERLVVVNFADDAGATAALRSGEIGAIMRPVTPEQVSVLESVDNLDVLQAPEYATTLLAYDTQREPFDNELFRQALDLAIDRELLVSDVYLGAATVGNSGWLHPDNPALNDTVETTFDPEEAERLLDEAGIVDSTGDGVRELDGTPLDLELLTYSNNALRMRIAEIVAQQLGEVGIGVSVAALEMDAMDELVWPGFDVAQGRNYDMAVWGWSAPTQADLGQIAGLVSSDHTQGNNNVTGFVSERADELATELRTVATPEEQAEIAFELQELIAEEMPFVTLLYADGAYGYRNDVYTGWVSITGQGPMNKLSFIPGDGRP